MIRDPWAALTTRALTDAVLKFALVVLAVVVATSCAIGLAGVVEDACGEVCRP